MKWGLKYIDACGNEILTNLFGNDVQAILLCFTMTGDIVEKFIEA